MSIHVLNPGGGESEHAAIKSSNHTLAFDVGQPALDTIMPDLRTPINHPINGWKQDEAGVYNPVLLDSHNMGNESIDEILDKLNRTVHLQNGDDTVASNFAKSVNAYNRFKVPMLNSMLSRAYPHIFFVSPNCNIFDEDDRESLAEGVSSHALFVMANSTHTGRRMLKELTTFGDNDFMFSLSNAAISFSPSDEYIGDDTYGRGYTGYKVAFGKHNVESRTAGTLALEFQDDKYFHIYQVHKLWEEYISNVFRGRFVPTMQTMRHKILDYVGALYYVVVGDDMETIIFWSKYYGVFPTTMPASQLSWSAGNVLGEESSRFHVSYRYSFKEDYNPAALEEFNYNARVFGSTAYLPAYDAGLGHAGETWVGTPFIEEVNTTEGILYKLRYRVP